MKIEQQLKRWKLTSEAKISKKFSLDAKIREKPIQKQDMKIIAVG